MNSLPRTIDPHATFDALVSWVHDELIVKRQAPGIVVGLSGTDSIITFLICAKAFEKAGKPGRVAGIHYGKQLPATDMPDADPQAFWFQSTLIPWLKEQAPQATILIDDSINERMDGQRWGALLDWSMIEDPETGRLRPAGENYWVAGTRNATEETLRTYSNVSMAASIQPISGLWKSEVLHLCHHLGVPEEAMAQSCTMDCACGRFELPALHIPYVDALLMTRNGELSPRYVEENITPSLRHELDEFIDTQLRNTAFKQHIPYHADRQAIHLAPSPHQEEYLTAKHCAQSGQPDVRPISLATPLLVHSGQAMSACDLVCTDAPARQQWLPEALALFATPGLDSNQQRRMSAKIFADDAIALPDAKRLSRCNARIGTLGFSFPRWRFLTQKSGEAPSLVEQFGMQRLSRPTDMRDPSLPPSDPARDALGTGFRWQDNQWHIEYRRAYLACSRTTAEGPITLIIRNNSHYFGRDRLPEAVYVSFEPLTSAQIDSLTPESLASSPFMPWQDMLRASTLSTKEKTKRVEAALNYLDAFDNNLHQWLRSSGPSEHTGASGPDHSAATDSGGLPHLIHFLQHKLAQPAAKDRPALYLSETTRHAAPWFPESARPLTRELLDTLSTSFPTSPAREFTLLSGEQGDFPIPADKAAQLLSERQHRAIHQR